MPLLSSFLFAVAFLFGSLGLFIFICLLVVTTDTYKEQEPLAAEMFLAAGGKLIAVGFILISISIILLAISAQL